MIVIAIASWAMHVEAGQMIVVAIASWAMHSSYSVLN